MPHHEPPASDPLAEVLVAALALLPSRRVLCVGDVMLDVDVDCSAGRMSPEAPVLVFAEGEHRARAGGAANVAANLAALGATTFLAGAVGMDDEGEQLAALLGALGVHCLFPDPLGSVRPTTRKTRFLADGQQVLRVDRECCAPLEQDEAAALLTTIETAPGPIHAVVVSDYGKGVVTERVMGRLRAIAQRYGAPLLIDPKGLAWHRYGHVDLIKPNAHELAAYTGLPCDSNDDVEIALARALELSSANAILVTRAAKGASLLRRGMGSAEHLPAREVEVADVCGAGDTNLATLGAMLAAGCSLEQGIALAQLASSLAVERHGNAVIGADELLAVHSCCVSISGAKEFLALEEVAVRVREWRAKGLRVGFTNGCFDILHPGHIRSLEMARSQCDRLIVGLNSDASVRRLKGADRPIVCEGDRAKVLAGLAAVDAVTLFDEDTPTDLIAVLRPDLLCKGGDYDPDMIAGADFVRSYGGSVIVCDYLAGNSTSSIIETIRRQSQTPSDHLFEKESTSNA